MTVNCDGHHLANFANLEYGIAVARRAWARPDQILNCQSAGALEEWLRGRSGREGATAGG
jgi:hypothetical protein